MISLGCKFFFLKCFLFGWFDIYSSFFFGGGHDGCVFSLDVNLFGGGCLRPCSSGGCGSCHPLGRRWLSSLEPVCVKLKRSTTSELKH